MTEPLQVGQFAIVDCEPVDRGPNAGVFHGRGPADDRAELYMVAEGTTPAGEAFAGHIVSAAGLLWGGLDISLTGALMRVFVDARRNLDEWNRKSIAQHRVNVGIACFGRRGPQAIIAQAGPSLALHVSGGRVTAYLPDEEHLAPGTAGVEPQLRRIDFLPGDRVLLVSSAAAGACDEELIAGILQLPLEQVLPELWRRLADLRHLTVLLVSAPGEPGEARLPASDGFVIDATTAAPPEEGPRPAKRPALAIEPTGAAADAFQPSLFVEARNEEAVSAARAQLLSISARARRAASLPQQAADVPEPLRRASGENVLARLAAEGRARAALSHAAATVVIPPLPQPAAPAHRPWRAAPASAHPGYSGEAAPARGGTPAPGGPPQPIELPMGDARRAHHRRPGSFSRGLVREEAPPAPEIHAEDVPLAADMAEHVRARAAVIGSVSETIAGENAATINTGGSLVRVRTHHSGRWKGGGGLSKRTTTAPGLPPTWLVIVVGLTVLLGLVGFLTVPGLLQRDGGERYASLIDSAQQKIATARSFQQDPTERRKALTEAQALLLEARDVPEHGPEAEQLINEVAGALSTMDAVRAPTSVETIASLEQFGEKPVAATRLVVSGTHAFILDGTSGQVIAIPLDGSERKVVFAEDKDAKRQRPATLAFLNGNDLGGPSLVIADEGGALWAWSAPQGLRQVNFAAPAGMKVTDIAVQGRDLYVLDAAASAVYRFSPGEGGGFSAGPVKVLDTPDLAAARRLMVDSEIVTADANGTLRRFTGQFSLILSEAGIDRRLIAPELPAPLAKNGDIALLDAPNDRIVVLRRDGSFDHQYRHADFKAMTAFAFVDGKGYVFSGGKLRKVTF